MYNPIHLCCCPKLWLRGKICWVSLFPAESSCGTSHTYFSSECFEPGDRVMVDDKCYQITYDDSHTRLPVPISIDVTRLGSDNGTYLLEVDEFIDEPSWERDIDTVRILYNSTDERWEIGTSAYYYTDNNTNVPHYAPWEDFPDLVLWTDINGNILGIQPKLVFTYSGGLPLQVGYIDEVVFGNDKCCGQDLVYAEVTGIDFNNQCCSLPFPPPFDDGIHTEDIDADGMYGPAVAVCGNVSELIRSVTPVITQIDCTRDQDCIVCNPSYDLDLEMSIGWDGEYAQTNWLKINHPWGSTSGAFINTDNILLGDSIANEAVYDCQHRSWQGVDGTVVITTAAWETSIKDVFTGLRGTTESIITAGDISRPEQGSRSVTLNGDMVVPFIDDGAGGEIDECLGVRLVINAATNHRYYLWSKNILYCTDDHMDLLWDTNLSKISDLASGATIDFPIGINRYIACSSEQYLHFLEPSDGSFVNSRIFEATIWAVQYHDDLFYIILRSDEPDKNLVIIEPELDPDDGTIKINDQLGFGYENRQPLRGLKAEGQHLFIFGDFFFWQDIATVEDNFWITDVAGAVQYSSQMHENRTDDYIFTSLTFAQR